MLEKLPTLAQTADEQTLLKFSPKESELHVAVNRNTSGGRKETAYTESGSRIIIEIEEDPDLRAFLNHLKSSGENHTNLLERARQIADSVVSLTTIDKDNKYHPTGRIVRLGQALNQPVRCEERALAIEAGLKMEGIQRAQLLISTDEQDTATSNHADVLFSANGEEEYVAITTGDRAGQIMTLVDYTTWYLEERRNKGLPERKVRKTWGRPYFEAT